MLLAIKAKLSPPELAHRRCTGLLTRLAHPPWQQQHRALAAARESQAGLLSITQALQN